MQFLIPRRQCPIPHHCHPACQHLPGCMETVWQNTANWQRNRLDISKPWDRCLKVNFCVCVLFFCLKECCYTNTEIHCLLPYFYQVLILESATREQADSEVWKEHRIGRLTASCFHGIFTKMNTITKDKSKTVVNVSSILARIMGYTSPSPLIPALKYGHTMEPVARDVYRKTLIAQGHKNVSVNLCGLFVDPELSYMGATPDGVVSCDCCGKGVVELKCPFSISHQAPSADNLPYLCRNEQGRTCLKKSHHYYDQCQGQLVMTSIINTKYCDFFVYTMYGSHCERILLDLKHWSRLQAQLCDFFSTFVVHELVTNQLADKFSDLVSESHDTMPKKVSTCCRIPGSRQKH